MYEVKSYYYTIDVYDFALKTIMGALPGRYAPLATLLNTLSYQPCLFSLILTSYTNMQHIQRILDIYSAFV